MRVLTGKALLAVVLLVACLWTLRSLGTSLENQGAVGLLFLFCAVISHYALELISWSAKKGHRAERPKK